MGLEHDETALIAIAEQAKAQQLLPPALDKFHVAAGNCRIVCAGIHFGLDRPDAEKGQGDGFFLADVNGRVHTQAFSWQSSTSREPVLLGCRKAMRLLS